MTTSAFWHRLGFFVKMGVKTGLLTFFWSSPIVLLLSIIGIAIGSAEFLSFLSLFTEDVILGFFVWLLFVIPYSLQGVFGGAVLGALLACQRKLVAPWTVGSATMLAGTAASLLLHYRIWLSRSTNFHRHYSFLQYLLPASSQNPVHFFLFTNPYFVPSVITLVVWFYLGWRMSKVRFPDVMV